MGILTQAVPKRCYFWIVIRMSLPDAESACAFQLSCLKVLAVPACWTALAAAVATHIIEPWLVWWMREARRCQRSHYMQLLATDRSSFKCALSNRF